MPVTSHFGGGPKTFGLRSDFTRASLTWCSRIMPMGLKGRKRLTALYRQGNLPPELPPELKGLEGQDTIVVWFDSGREVRLNRSPRWTTAWVYQTLGRTHLDRDAFLLKASGMGGLMRNPPDPCILRNDRTELRSFESKLPSSANFEKAPIYVTDLIAAWYGLAILGSTVTRGESRWFPTVRMQSKS